MTPQEWLDAYDKDAIHPRTIYDERASTIIRDLLAEVERLQESGNEILRCNKLWEEKYHAAQALAATHLADQELLVGQERKRVARECLKAVDDEPEYPGDPVNLRRLLTEHKDEIEVMIMLHRLTVKATKRGIADRIRTRYGVEG